MDILNVLLVLCLISCSSSMILQHNPLHRTLRKASDEKVKSSNSNDKTSHSTIKNAENLFMCISDNCYLITEFKIMADNSFSCEEQHIMIELVSLKKLNLTDEKKVIVGYLTQKGTIVDSQEYSTVCKLVKRY